MPVRWEITYSLRRHVGGVGLYPVEELLRHQNETAAVWFIDARTFAQGRVDKRLVRDEGVAASNPATPTSFSFNEWLTGNDMGNETPKAARRLWLTGPSAQVL